MLIDADGPRVKTGEQAVNSESRQGATRIVPKRKGFPCGTVEFEPALRGDDGSKRRELRRNIVQGRRARHDIDPHRASRRRRRC